MQLIARASGNNRQAQHELYQLYAPKMLSICRMYIKDMHHAEEVMLDGFFKVFTHLKDFNNQGSFEGWMRRIMVRESIDFLRKKAKVIFQDTLGHKEVVFEEGIQSNLEVAHIQNAIDALPEGYRIIFIMYAIEGYKHHEISKILHITEGTSKSQLHKARKMLQEKLNKKATDYGTE